MEDMKKRQEETSLASACGSLSKKKKKKKVTDYTSLLQIFNRKCVRFLLKSSAKLLTDFFSQ